MSTKRVINLALIFEANDLTVEVDVTADTESIQRLVNWK